LGIEPNCLELDHWLSFRLALFTPHLRGEFILLQKTGLDYTPLYIDVGWKKTC